MSTKVQFMTARSILVTVLLAALFALALPHVVKAELSLTIGDQSPVGEERTVFRYCESDRQTPNQPGRGYFVIRQAMIDGDQEMFYMALTVLGIGCYDRKVLKRPHIVVTVESVFERFTMVAGCMEMVRVEDSRGTASYAWQLISTDPC